MDKKVRVYIEIEKDSNQKFEYNPETKTLELDRVLKEPFVYPYPYGFATNTKAKDNDELDILILTNKKIMKDTYHDVFIVGVLVMEDENGMDEKVLCVFEEDYKVIKDIINVTDDIKEKIRYFFTNYKTNTDGRWSKVYGYEDKNFAIKLYKDSLLI
jgi:inorganic pyrophosphatase